MDTDIKQFLEVQKVALYEEKRRLKIIQDVGTEPLDLDNTKQQPQCDSNLNLEEKENVNPTKTINKNDPLVETLLPLTCHENDDHITAADGEQNDWSCLEREKQAFIDKIARSENPLTFRSDVSVTGHSMLRYGEYSPNNPLHYRVNAAPYLGLGEYDQRHRQQQQQQLQQQQLKSAAYKNNINKRNERIKCTGKRVLIDTRVVQVGNNKSVQTDLKNIRNKLIQYALSPSNNNNTADSLETNCYDSAAAIETEDDDNDNDNVLVDYEAEANSNNSDSRSVMHNNLNHNNRSPVLSRLDQRLSSVQTRLMDKQPRGILSNRHSDSSPRDRLLSDLKHSYVPSVIDGFSYTDRAEDFERERIKKEMYQNELRLQIEEKRRFAAMREEQERREQDLENRRLEQQLLRMQEEQIRDEQRRTQLRRNSDDFQRRKQELQSRSNYRRHTDSESSIHHHHHHGNTGVGGGGGHHHSSNKTAATVGGCHYSPPVTRRSLYTGGGGNHSHSYQGAVGGGASGGGGGGNLLPSSCSTQSVYVGGGGGGVTGVNSDPLRYNPSAMRNRMDSLGVASGGGYHNYDTHYNTYGGSGCARNNVTHGGGHHSGGGFGRYDSLSRIDSMKQQDAFSRLETLSINDSYNRMQRRHSATQQDLSMTRRSPKLQRRSSSSRFEDSLPIPILKAHSPVARELKNSIAVNSTKQHSDALRKLEDKWQIPAVQKNIMNYDVYPDGHSRSILTQLGAIRLQLQQEQLRMDETLRRRGMTSSHHHKSHSSADFH